MPLDWAHSEVRGGEGMHEKRLVQARLAWPEHPDYDLHALQLSGIENPHDLGLITADAAA